MSSGARGQVGTSYYIEYLQLLGLLYLFLFLLVGIIVFYVERILQISTYDQVNGGN